MPAPLKVPPKRANPGMLAIAATLALVPVRAEADPFDAGSLIIPMDIDYQDMGMLRAFGLV